jgi:protein O-GlcNAc transferase
MTPQTQALIGQAIQLLQSGLPDKAESILKKILEVQKNNLPALEIMGLIKGSQGKHAECAEYLRKAVRINPNNPATQYNLAKALSDSGEYEKAIHHHQKAVALAPTNQDAWINYGTALSLINDNLGALDKFDKALSLNSVSEEALFNKFLLLKKMGNLHDCHQIIDQLIFQSPTNSEYLCNKSEIFIKQSQFLEALPFAEKAADFNQNNYKAWLLLGEIKYKLKRLDDAFKISKKLIELNPRSSEPWCNTGAVLNEMKRYKDAIYFFNCALEIDPYYAEALGNLGIAQLETREFANSASNLHQAYSLKPTIQFLLCSLVHAKSMIAEWSDIDRLINTLIIKIDKNQDLCPPFYLLYLSDNPRIQLESAKKWAEFSNPIEYNSIPLIKKSLDKRIRIGYFSSDLRNHPVSQLLIEVFESHNKVNFETHAFSFQKAENNDPLIHRVKKSFNFFHDVTSLSDQEVALFSRSLDIDIAIDLNGYTQGSRHNVFFHRAAPIQISYLGYAGTSGSNYIDYLLADKFVIPESDATFYSEKILYLPKCFITDDSKRIASNAIFSKKDFLIPDDSFVFCCFNASYKFNKRIVNIWSKILYSVPNSVLWLSKNNSEFTKNIISEFSINGINENRIFFIDRISSINDHLKRIQLADLFLDTFPYNAHTTAIDAIRSHVPLLTLKGSTFAGRVSLSILSSLGLSELIADTEDEYIYKAIQLATNRMLLNSCRLKLIESVSKSSIFNGQEHCKQLETIFVNLIHGQYDFN